MNGATPIHRHTLCDLLHRSAARHPRKLAVACGAARWSYGEFDALCDRVGAGLAERGVGKGDRVAILARNSHGFAALRFALARLGAVLVPINFMLKAEEAAYSLRHAGAKWLATDSGWPTWRGRPPRTTPRSRTSSGCPQRHGVVAQGRDADARRGDVAVRQLRGRCVDRRRRLRVARSSTSSSARRSMSARPTSSPPSPRPRTCWR